MEEYKHWVLRVMGSRLVAHWIRESHTAHLFKVSVPPITPSCLFPTFTQVSNKTIWPLPLYPMTKEHLKRRKNFILITDDLDLLPSKESMALWEDPNVLLRNELSRELLRLIKNVGLRDACLRENTPFSHDGRIALIDTQSWHERHFTCHPPPSWPETYQGIGSQPIIII